ncbi:hypothetical protein [uncultured Algibacter sp.]|uniref:hypothetical protein n=1 Tax=uncultured Algibacter sp. TaxID=298659 RepID=UPI0032167445
MKTKIVLFFTAVLMISASKPILETKNNSGYLELIQTLDFMANDFIESGNINYKLADKTDKLRIKLINKDGYEKFKKEFEINLQTYFSIEFPKNPCINATGCYLKAYNEYSISKDISKFFKAVKRCKSIYCSRPNGDGDGDGEPDGPIPF